MACVLTLLYAFNFLVSSYGTRVISSASKLYLLDNTPTEVISLVFLLLVTYGVAGSTVALLRINLMFFFIVVGIILLLQMINFGFFEAENIKPGLITDWNGILNGSKEAYLYFVGMEILLFYGFLMKRPTETSKAMIIGITIPILLYLIIFIFTIGVLSNDVVRNMIYPSIAIAKEVELPGGFFERFESVFFTIMIMTIFNTTAMAFNVSILALGSIFHTVKKGVWILILAPIIYIFAMSLQSIIDLHHIRQFFIYIGMISSALIPSLLLVISKLRGVKGSE